MKNSKKTIDFKKNHKFKEELFEYLTTLEKNPKDIDLRKKIAKTYEELKLFDEAIYQYDKILELDSKNIEVEKKLHWLLFKKLFQMKTKYSKISYILSFLTCFPVIFILIICFFTNDISLISIIAFMFIILSIPEIIIIRYSIQLNKLDKIYQLKFFKKNGKFYVKYKNLIYKIHIKKKLFNLKF